MTKVFFLLISISLFTKNTLASSDVEWSAHNKKVLATCLKQSGLKKAKAVGDIFRFSDTTGYDALFIEGIYPQPHMKNAKGKALCLFNRKTGLTETSESR